MSFPHGLLIRMRRWEVNKLQSGNLKLSEYYGIIIQVVQGPRKRGPFLFSFDHYFVLDLFQPIPILS